MNTCRKISIVNGVFHGIRMLPGAINAVYLIDLGMPLKDIALLQLLFSICIFIFEIPTGILADYLSKKKAIILGIINVGIYFFTMAFSSNFSHLVVAQLFYALGLCMLSGTFEAWLVATAREEFPTNTKKIDHFNYLRNEINFFTTMFAGLIGAMLAFYTPNGYRTVYFLGFVLTLTLILFLPKTKSTDSQNPKLFSIIDHLSNVKNDIKVTFKSKIAFIFIAIQIGFAFTYQIVFFYWQPYFQNLSKLNVNSNFYFIKGDILLGIVFFSYSLIRGVIMKIFNKKLELYNAFSVAIISLVFSSLLMLLFSNSLEININLYIYIVAFSLIQGLVSLASIALESQFMKILPTNSVASIISIANSVTYIFSMAFLAIISNLISNNNLPAFFRSVVFIYIGIAFIILYLKKKISQEAIKNFNLKENYS